MGCQVRRAIVIPSRIFILVRFGTTADRAARDSNGFIREVVSVLPADP